MNKEISHKILSWYISQDRETLMHFIPVDWNNKKWLAATDATQFVMIPENEENKIEKTDDLKTPDLKRVIPQFSLNGYISIKKLKKAYDDIEEIEQQLTEECDSCDGKGEFEHYDETYECKKCDETGEIGTNKHEMVKNPNVFFSIYEGQFKAKHIYNLIKVIELTKCKQVEMRSTSANGVNIFELDNQIIIGIMPYMLPSNSRIIII